jgi:hypothetical protein
MPVIGNSGQPGFAYFAYGGSSQPNQNAELLTNDTGGAISVTTLGAWLGGWNATARVSLVIWAADGSFLGITPEFTAANEGAAALGHIAQYERTLAVPVVIAAGASFYVGASRNRNDAVQYSTGGTVNDHIEATAPYPGGDLGSLGTATVARRTGMYVADYLPAITTRSATKTLNGIVEVKKTSTKTLNAIVEKKIGSNKTLNAIVEKKVSSTKTLNAIVEKNVSSTKTINSIVKVKISATKTLNAIVQVPGSDSLTLDAIVAKSVSSSAALNATVKSKISSTKILDAIVFRRSSATATLDAISQGSSSSSATLDAWTSVSPSQSTTLDAEIALVHAPTWTTPLNGVPMSATPTLAFLIPFGIKAMHFQIELDTADMSEGDLTPDYRLYDSTVDQTGWEYWNGSTWVAVPPTGVPITYIGNEAHFIVSVALASGFWFRRVRAGVLWP